MQNNKIQHSLLRDSKSRLYNKIHFVNEIMEKFPKIDTSLIEYSSSDTKISYYFFYDNKKYVLKDKLLLGINYDLSSSTDKISEYLFKVMLGIIGKSDKSDAEEFFKKVKEDVLELIKTPDIFDFIFPKLLEETEDVFLYDRLIGYRSLDLNDFYNDSIMSGVIEILNKYYVLVDELSDNGWFLYPGPGADNWMINEDTNDIKYVDNSNYTYLHKSSRGSYLSDSDKYGNKIIKVLETKYRNYELDHVMRNFILPQFHKNLKGVTIIK